MNLKQFAERHAPALAADEIRHNVLLAVLKLGLHDPSVPVSTWDLGKPGCCAIQQQGRGILLGDVGEADTRDLARIVADQDIPSVMGAGETARWFVEASRNLGRDFPNLMAQTIQVLDHAPSVQPRDGAVRLARQDDVDLVFHWLCDFVTEAVPHDPPPTREEANRRIEESLAYLWCLDDQPVAMSCVGRVLERGVAIAPVYTPPEHRCRGYAGAATGAIVEEVLKRGYRYAYLFTDDSNPASNRCYANIGFRPYCKANMYRRD
jgi:predicted GNAT family acetyltransferase